MAQNSVDKYSDVELKKSCSVAVAKKYKLKIP